MPFQKGNKLAGSRKGVPNKANAALKDMILQALEGVGGVAYLQTQARENPASFLTLVGKVLPMQLAGEGGGPVLTRVIHEEARERDGAGD